MGSTASPRWFVISLAGCSSFKQSSAVQMVDKSIEPKVGKVVIAAINGEMTVKRLSVVDGQMTLTADNPNYPDVKVGDFASR